MATGLRFERLANGQIWRWYEQLTGETVHIKAPITFYDDFVGTALGDLWWTAVDAGAATQAYVTATAEPGGVVALTLTTEDLAQDAAITFNDVLAYRMGSTTVTTRFLQFECRLKVKVLPTTGTEEVEMFWGLGSAADVGAPTSIAQHMGFMVSSDVDSGGQLMCSTDDNSTDTTDQDTTVNLVADDQYRIYRIDASDLTSVRFYVDGVDKTPATMTMAGLTAGIDGFQPIVSVGKDKSSNNTGTGTIECDYVRVWGTR
jgi:hypothetical protein